jgi:hypothetical protein
MPTPSEILVGTLTGLIQTFIFNPIDRALYLHIKDHTNFLARSNWINPYHGVFNALGNRVIQYGFYYNIVDFYLEIAMDVDFLGSTSKRVAAGIATGMTTAVLLNPVSCVKYHSWGTEHKLSYVARDMFRRAGLHSFTRGLGSTAVRDSSFSTIYLTCKRYIDAAFDDQGRRFLGNLIVSCFATIITSPINYVRNMKYAAGYEQSNPSFMSIFSKLVQDQRASHKGFINSTRYYFNRFAIGWGTVRVGLGVATGQHIYDKLLVLLDGGPHTYTDEQ